MEIENEFDVPAPIDHVWTYLLDVERVAPCMPGASPTMTRRASATPNGGTGLHQYPGCASRTTSRNVASRAQRRHEGSKRGSPGLSGRMLALAADMRGEKIVARACRSTP